jgi:hypothetical protein
MQISNLRQYPIYFLVLVVLFMGPKMPVSPAAAKGRVNQSAIISVQLTDLPTRANHLVGRRILTQGYVTMNSESMNLLRFRHEAPNQVCIGILVTRKDFNEMNKFDGEWKRITGILETNRCTGENYCPHTCGPNVLTNAHVLSD